MATLCSCEYQNYNYFMFKLYPSYVCLLYLKKCQKHIHQGQKNREDKNISFYFLWTKIKI